MNSIGFSPLRHLLGEGWTGGEEEEGEGMGGEPGKVLVQSEELEPKWVVEAR